MSDSTTAAFETNRKRWDVLAAVHRRDATGFYGVERFLSGDDTLNPIELAELGAVDGLRIAHLQCHFGMDSIRLARLGAQVTGLDFSETAIAEAKLLAKQTGAEVEFKQGNVYDARTILTGTFDMVYTTWGTIIWLPDVMGWARVIASLLRPGGWLYFADAHPMLLCHEVTDGQIVMRDDWQTPVDRPLAFSSDTSYTGDKTADLAGYEWIHATGSIVNALIAAGLRLDWLNEHKYLPWQQLPNMVRRDGGLFSLPPDCPQLPVALSIKATRTS